MFTHALTIGRTWPLIALLLALPLASPRAHAQAAPDSCPQQQPLRLEQHALAQRSQALDAEIDRWPLRLPIIGLAASVLGFGAIAYVEGRVDRPSLTWGLAAIPAAGAATALGFITYRAVKRQPFTSERRRIAQRRSELAARDLMLAHTRCSDEATLARAAHASIMRIDAQLMQVQQRTEAVPMAAPLTLTVTGSLMAGGFGFAILMAELFQREENRPRLIGFGVGALTGVAMATTGIAWTVKRGRERREIKRAAGPLKEQRRGLELMLQPSASLSHASLALNGRF